MIFTSFLYFLSPKQELVILIPQIQHTCSLATTAELSLQVPQVSELSRNSPPKGPESLSEQWIQSLKYNLRTTMLFDHLVLCRQMLFWVKNAFSSSSPSSTFSRSRQSHRFSGSDKRVMLFDSHLDIFIFVYKMVRVGFGLRVERGREIPQV